MQRRDFLKTAMAGGAALWLPDTRIVRAQAIPFPGPGDRTRSAAAIAFVVGDYAHGNNATSGTSAGVDTSGANFLVIGGWTWRNSVDAALSVSDSKSNTWTEVATNSPQSYDTHSKCHIFYSVNPTVGSSHTFTLTSVAGGSLYFYGFMGAFSGVATSSPLDVSAGATGNSTSPSSGATGTLAQSTELAIAVCGTPGNVNPTITAGNSFTIPTNGKKESFAGSPGGPPGAFSYKLGVGTSAQTGAFTLTGGSDIWGAIVATFKQ